MILLIDKVYYKTGIFIVHEESANIVSLVDQPDYTPTDYLIGDTLIFWTIGFYQDTSNFPAGNYQMVPYILVKQSGIPADLLTSLGDNVYEFHQDYLNLPFKRSGGNFTIIE